MLKYIFIDIVPFWAFRGFKRNVYIILGVNNWGSNDYLWKVAKGLWIGKLQIGIQKVKTESIVIKP